MPYLLDTNIFISAHRVHYPIDIMTSYWAKIKDLAFSQEIFSIDKVKKEIYKNEDDLKRWCESNLPDDFFKDSSSCISKYRDVVKWAARDPRYTQQAINEFLEADEADAWLVSYAWEYNMKLVTYEISQPNIKRKIKIPEACVEFNLIFKNPIDMLRELNQQI